MRYMKNKAAIFDFNGTLLWDTAYHNKSHDIFLEKHNIHLTDEEKREKIHGKPNAGAGKIYIVDSSNDDYSCYSHEIITHFDQVDREIFISP
ncbi:MAG: hypothetical protein RDV48_25605 [Candidatus Eremiobacteraeota bacterium]|nr:hypothetical protein [Candidatus Eremiobacteraeota bacterium]